MIDKIPVCFLLFCGDVLLEVWEDEFQLRRRGVYPSKPRILFNIYLYINFFCRVFPIFKHEVYLTKRKGQTSNVRRFRDEKNPQNN